jgi:tRNA threonylcarbamoyladenosine biosynthesis protein TsaB
MKLVTPAFNRYTSLNLYFCDYITAFMKLIAIDTSTEACSASLYDGNETYTRFEIAPRRHAELILPMVKSLLDECDLSLTDIDVLAFGRGPGAFTGVRIATGVIQGLAYSASLPVVAVSSLAALAQSVATEHAYIMPAFDARMGEIYCGFYQTMTSGVVAPVNEESVIAPDNLDINNDITWYGIGSGWQTYADTLTSQFKVPVSSYRGDAWPSSEHIVPLALEKICSGKTVSAEYVRPVYLRNRVTG